MITITITNTIAIDIAIAIISISPRLNAHTYTHNWWEAGTRFRWKIWVGDLLSLRSKYLPFLQNLWLQLSTPWLWGIVRFGRGGHAKDKVQTMMSTDVMSSATIRSLPPATCHLPPATRHTPTPPAARQTLPAVRHQPHASRCIASATQQVSGSSMQEHTWEYIVK